MTTTEETQPVRTVRDLIAAVDRRETETAASYLTDDVRFRFGSAEEIAGKPAVEAQSRAFYESIAGIRHTFLGLWQVTDDTVACVMDVHYERLDGRTLTLPCANVFRFRDGLVDDYRIYMDISPVFGA
jgi:ketosteroid isomerase-like protein